MPTYDYECPACGHRFEHFQSISDKLLRTCPECGARKLRRLFGTGIGVVFKGSGFYETDYKRKPERTTNTKSVPSSGQADAKTGKSDAERPDTSGKETSASDKPSGPPADKRARESRRDGSSGSTERSGAPKAPRHPESPKSGGS